MGMDQITLRLMARHAQLQRAVRQDEVKDVARAGARARLASLELLPSERAAAQQARAMVGRALREARLRAKQPKADLSLIAAPVAKRRSRRLRAVALVTLVLLLALLLWEVVPGAPASTTVAEDPGGSLAGGAVAQTQASDKSRGRTVDLVVAVTAEASPAPEPSPAATPFATNSNLKAGSLKTRPRARESRGRNGRNSKLQTPTSRETPKGENFKLQTPNSRETPRFKVQIGYD